jgi:uncharacterized protein (AIM24 family)
MNKSHEIDYQIKGESIQIVEVELDPSETVIAEAGAMLFMEDGIQFETKMGDGSNPNQGLFDKLLSAGSRILTGESIFMTHFTNRGARRAKVGFSAPYPGTVIPIDLALAPNRQIIVQKDGFLCAAYGLEGDGKAFVHAGGTVIEKTLNNETLRVDTGCVVAFEPQIDFDVQMAGGLRSVIFGGEGIFVATLRGTGKVWLQSMPIRKLVQALAPYGRNSGKEGSSLIGSIFER